MLLILCKTHLDQMIKAVMLNKINRKESAIKSFIRKEVVLIVVSGCELRVKDQEQ